MTDAQVIADILITFSGLFLIGRLIFSLLLTLVQTLKGPDSVTEILAAGAREGRG